MGRPICGRISDHHSLRHHCFGGSLATSSGHSLSISARILVDRLDAIELFDLAAYLTKLGAGLDPASKYRLTHRAPPVPRG
jgi:hypothetical protein